MTLTSDPVSTKNRRPMTLSSGNLKRAAATASNRPSSLAVIHQEKIAAPSSRRAYTSAQTAFMHLVLFLLAQPQSRYCS